MQRVSRIAPPIDDNVGVDAGTLDTLPNAGPVRLPHLGPPSEALTASQRAHEGQLADYRNRLDRLKFLFDERKHQLEGLVQGAAPWKYVGATVHSKVASTSEFADEAVRLPIELLHNIGDCLSEAERMFSKIDPTQPMERQRSHLHGLEVFSARAETQLRSYDQKQATYQKRIALGQKTAREVLTGVAAGAAGVAVPGIGPGAMAAAGAAASTDLAISVHERDEGKTEQELEWGELLSQAAQAGLSEGLPGYMMGRAFRFLTVRIAKALGKETAIGETPGRHPMHMKPAELPQEVPWYSDHIPEQELARSIGYLRWYSFKHFDHEYHPLYWQYLDLRKQNPIGALDPRRRAINASSVVTVVKLWQQVAKELVEHPPGNLHQAQQAKELLDRTTEILERRKVSLHELEEMSTQFFALDSSVGYKMRFDQGPPPSYGVGYFHHSEAGTKTAAGVGSRNFVPRPTDADGFRLSRSEFTQHDAAHHVRASPYPEVASASAQSSVKGQGASFVHDAPRLTRQAHFKDWLEQQLETIHHDQADRVRMIYQVLTHEYNSFDFPHYVSPLPEHLLAAVRGDRTFVINGSVVAYRRHGKSVSKNSMKEAANIFSSRCEDYLRQLPDGATRLLNAEFNVALEKFVRGQLAVRIVKEVQLRVHSNNPTIQDYLLFLTRDANFRERIRLQQVRTYGPQAGVRVGQLFDSQYDAVVQFVEEWADKHGIVKSHPVEFFRGVNLQKRPESPAANGQ